MKKVLSSKALLFGFIFIAFTVILWVSNTQFIPVTLESDLIKLEVFISLKSLFTQEVPGFNENASLNITAKTIGITSIVLLGVPFFTTRIIYRNQKRHA